ncbi:hypothetical protein CGMCC3_g16162 [Colletotrichum fructicola]|nr:uncharacterized protein CGMCC3_g16162 [Colletotrichum fructicola]KAE9567720.1 hypothetical protein CGMCC3_g16162 [Colletotrichum fructicola]
MSAAQATETVPDHEVVVAADEAEEELVVDDAASDRAPSAASSSTSLKGSVLDYRIENGRTYHAYKDGKYNLPNDETENDRLDLQHNLFLLTFDDKLGNAPPNDKDAKVGRVLDVGTGTGIWCVDFGDEHPEAEILGVDLSATFPEFTPPNVRMMNGCINDWEVYAKKCYNNLNPGGWEFKDKSIHAYWPMYSIYGRKPEKADSEDSE